MAFIDFTATAGDLHNVTIKEHKEYFQTTTLKTLYNLQKIVQEDVYELEILGMCVRKN
jgi:hypothetical protein